MSPPARFEVPALWAALVFTAACAHSARPAPLVLFGAGASEAVVGDTIGLFEAQSGLTVKATFAAVGALRDKVLAGEPADVLIVTPAIITALDAQHKVHAGSRVDLGRVGGGLAVKTGTPPPAITTVDEFKQALIDADEVYYADPAVATAGAALMRVVDLLGIGDRVRAKGHLAPGGKEAMQQMARSTAARAVGVTQVSEILSVPEVMLVAEYPGDLQVKTTYSAIILEGSTRSDDAQRLVQFLSGPVFQARLARSGFDVSPVAARTSETRGTGRSR